MENINCTIRIKCKRHPAYGLIKAVIGIELHNERPWLKVSKFPEHSPIPGDTDNVYLVAPSEYEIIAGALPEVKL